MNAELLFRSIFFFVWTVVRRFLASYLRNFKRWTYETIKKIMNAEFLLRSIFFCMDNGGLVFASYVSRFYAPLIKTIWTMRDLHGLNGLTYSNVTYRITAKWLFVLVFVRRGWATTFRMQQQKGILKYEQELCQKGPLYTHLRFFTAIHNRRSRLCILLPFYPCDIRFWHFNRWAEISWVKLRERGISDNYGIVS